MTARFRRACALPLALGLALAGAAILQPRAAATPAAPLGTVAMQLSDTHAIAAQQQKRPVTVSRPAPSRPAVSRPAVTSRPAVGRSSFTATRSVSGTRAVTGGRSFTATRAVTAKKTLSVTPASRGIRGVNTMRPTRSFGSHAVGTRTKLGTGAVTPKSHAVQGPATLGTRTRGPSSLTRGPGSLGTRLGTRGPSTLTVGPGTRGPGALATRSVGVHATGAARFATIHGRHVHISREPRRIWMAGIWRTIVPVAALTGIYLGARYYYPDGYVTLARPYCSGVTPDGCALRWQEVGIEGGGSDWQCVQYCERVEAAAPPPLPPVAAAAPVPTAAFAQVPPPAGNCDLVVFSDANFAGMSAPTAEDQPRLSDVGWKNEIASVQVRSGTWDFYAEDDFAGEAMRLPPGTYGDLGPWSKRIGSFMCSQP